MKLKYTKQKHYLLIAAEGRLDASWAEYFKDELLQQIRQGEHHFIVDADQLLFLSSAGIRSLLQVYKELKGVSGSWQIVRPTAFVRQTLETSGFKEWLADDYPLELQHYFASAKTGDASLAAPPAKEEFEFFNLSPEATLQFSVAAGWRPWNTVALDEVVSLPLTSDIFALGIGSSAATPEEAKELFGEFVAVAGNVAYQSAEEQNLPDYLVSEGSFVPSLQALQALVMKGKMGELMRFAPEEERTSFALSELLGQVLKQSNGRPTGWVMVAEIEGVTGSCLIRSPALRHSDQPMEFPEVRDWVSFCGERLYLGQQAVVVGIVTGEDPSGLAEWVTPLPSVPGLSVHAHAVVFPFQPLQSGVIDLGESVSKYFNAAPPLAVMHLLDDQRPGIGLGESRLVRGACWFSPLKISGETQ